MGTYVGLDLAWSSGWTGAAVVDAAGRLSDSCRLRTDDEIADWVDGLGEVPVVVAVDAPLVVPNQTGQRLPETLMARTFGAYGASAHTSNRAKFGGDPRAKRLADRFGWEVDPASDARPLCLEVYPHPALVGLFALEYRLDYKKGGTRRRTPGFQELVRRIGSIPELALAEHPRWGEIRSIAADPRPGDLGRIEDEVDGILCAHLAWLWVHRREALRVYGDVHTGYIVAPPQPTHRAVRPPRIS